MRPWGRVPRATFASLWAAAAVLAGCGTARTPAPDLSTPAAGGGGAGPVAFERAGVAFSAPSGWRRRGAEQAPLVASLSSGRATVNIFRYERSEPLPATGAELDEAARRLEDAARQRDPSLQFLRRSTTRVGSRPAVVLRATETIEGQRRTVRSTHVYGDGVEVVVDAIAPAADVARLERGVFEPLVRSVRIVAAGA